MKKKQEKTKKQKKIRKNTNCTQRQGNELLIINDVVFLKLPYDVMRKAYAIQYEKQMQHMFIPGNGYILVAPKKKGKSKVL